MYNGKELDTDFGLNWYHYGARMYDPAVGRFTGVDPISDKFPELSTYNYASNDPIKNIDLHGLQGTRADIRFNHRVNNFLKGKITREEFLQGNRNEGMGAVAGASIFIPGPEDVALAGFAATKIGGRILGGISKLADDVIDGVKGFFKSGDTGTSFLSKADFDTLPTEGTIDPKSIRFSQDNIKNEFSDGKSFDDLINGLKDGTISADDIPAIRIVKKDGKIFSLDNRRLNAFQEAGVDIRFKKLDKIPRKERRKFSTENDGESIELRQRKNN